VYADASTFRSGQNARNEVQFKSKAPLETITGRTSNAEAAVTISNIRDLTRGIAVTVTVDLASLDTNIALRDQHMRDHYLETDKYPTAVFTLQELESAYTTSQPDGRGAKTSVHALEAGVPTHLVVKGELNLHGVRREITVDDLTVTYYPQGEESKAVFRGDDGDMLTVSGVLRTKLSTHSIRRPQFVLLKLADDITVNFTFALCSGIAGPPLVVNRPAVTRPRVLARPQRASLPPELHTEIAFLEDSGNKILDAGEAGEVRVTIHNTGLGPATDLHVKLTDLGAAVGLTYRQTYTIAEIAPGETKTLDVPLRAAISIPEQKVRLRIAVLDDVWGADALPALLSFDTRPETPPELTLATFGIDDDRLGGDSQGNDNGKIEFNELIAVTVAIQNAGPGEARAVSLSPKLTSEGVIYSSETTTFQLGAIAPGAWKETTFSVFVSRRFQGVEIPVQLTISEERKRFSVSEELILTLGEQSQRATEINVQGISQETRVVVQAPPVYTVDVDVEIPKTNAHMPDAFAVVIGNRDYLHPDVPDVDYALRDANVMKEYLVSALGFLDGNVLFIENAAQGTFNGVFGTENDHKGRLYDLVKPDISDVFIYYSGHGAPNPGSREGYFVPVECDPTRVHLNGYSLDLFYRNIAKIPAKTLTVVIDSCFSGSSQEGSLLGGISPIVPEIDNPLLTLEDATILTASRGNEVSGWYHEKRHGLFTYFFLKALSGAADDGDGRLSLSEVRDYVTDSAEGVPYWARRLHSKEQHPQIKGPDDRVLVRY
jgi:polyisoprenoid-binding protein YceI